MEGGDVMLPFDELESAADMVRDLAAKASPPPWYEQDSDYAWSLHGDMQQILRAPKDGPPYAEWPNEADAAWIITFSPAIAPWLEAMLRRAANDLRQVWDSLPPGDEGRSRAAGSIFGDALGLARAIRKAVASR
jgi:hypothetical protein